MAWSSFYGAADVFPPLFYLLIILYFGQIELVINSVQKRGKVVFVAKLNFIAVEQSYKTNLDFGI
jgi:hypothetical protein